MAKKRKVDALADKSEEIAKKPLDMANKRRI
jgi:hypothetical protein